MDSVWKQEKLEARKMLDAKCAAHQVYAACFVGRLLLIETYTHNKTNITMQWQMCLIAYFPIHFFSETMERTSILFFDILHIDFQNPLIISFPPFSQQQST